MTQPIEFTSTTPRFALPFLFAGQAQKEFFVNEAHALTDILLHTAIKGEQAAPPATSNDGDVWLVADSGTGAWLGHSGELACTQAGVWKFIMPRSGMRVFDESTGQFAVYSTDWSRAAAPNTPDSGQIVDVELRAAFGDLIEALANAGIFPEAS